MSALVQLSELSYLVAHRWYSTPAGMAHPPHFHFGHGKSASRFGRAACHASLLCRQLTLILALAVGLSYTSWQYTALQTSAASVSFRLTNSGTLAGSEISQLYLQFPASADEPPLQLKGFAKTRLAPGASATVTIRLTPREFSVWSDALHAYVPQRGSFGVEVGSSSADIRLTGSLTRTE